MSSKPILPIEYIKKSKKRKTWIDKDITRLNKSNAQKKRWVGKKFTREQVIKKFKEMHGNKYDYSKVKFNSVKDRVIIICKKHKHEFMRNVFDHYNNKGTRCPLCVNEDKSKNSYWSKFTKSDEYRKNKVKELIKDFKKVHGNRYDYSKVEWVNKTTKIKIICKIHGEFLQSHQSHKEGTNCQKCARRGGYNSSHKRPTP